MPAPARSTFKNATGLIKNSSQVTRRSSFSENRRFASSLPLASASSQSAPNTNTRNIHLSPQPPKQRQITPTSTTSAPSASYPKQLLADLAAAAWSTSPVNTGNPFFNEAPSFNPPAQEPATPQQIYDPAIDLSAIYWTTSPANPGAIISDSFLALTPSVYIPARSLEAYDNIMASDEDYQAFLDKAGADREPQQSTQSKTPANTQSKVNTQSLPAALQNVQQHTYVSDADEAFEPVSLTREKGHSGSLEVKEVAQLAGAKENAVEKISMDDFDPRGQYKEVIKAVEQASKGEVTAWKVGQSSTRVEYWLLGLSGDAHGDGHVVGARAKAVES